MNKINAIVFPFLNTVFFPHTYMPVSLERPEHITLIKTAMYHGIPLALFQPQANTAPKVCSLANVAIVNEYPNGGIQILLLGIGKGTISSMTQAAPYYLAKIDLAYDSDFQQYHLQHPEIKLIHETLTQWITTQIPDSKHQKVILGKINTVNAILDYACLFLLKDKVTRKVILEENSMSERVQLIKHVVLSSEKHSGLFLSNALQSFEILDENNALSCA